MTDISYKVNHLKEITHDLSKYKQLMFDSQSIAI